MLSIIILSYKNPALLRLCLSSLAKAPPSSNYEVIVVDNETTPETQSVVQDEFQKIFSNISLVPITKNAGYTRGVNEGIRHAKGDYILALNYDIVVPPHAIDEMLNYAKQHPQIGLIGPELLNFNDTHQDSYFRFYTPMIVVYRRMPYLPGAKKSLDRFLMSDASPEDIVKPNWLSGSALMTSRSALEKVGLMDEKLFHYMSDVDWCRRFWENGYEVVYYPTAKMYHYHGRSSKGRFGIFDALLNKATRWHIQDAIRYFIKYGFTTTSLNHYGLQRTKNIN